MTLPALNRVMLPLMEPPNVPAVSRWSREVTRLLFPTMPPPPGRVFWLERAETPWLLPLRSSVPAFTTSGAYVGRVAPGPTKSVSSRPLLRVSVPALIVVVPVTTPAGSGRRCR